MCKLKLKIKSRKEDIMENIKNLNIQQRLKMSKDFNNHKMSDDSLNKWKEKNSIENYSLKS